MSEVVKIASEELRFRIHCLHYWAGYGRTETRRKILVNGSPKTGTTWMMKLIASIPGYRLIGNFNGDISRYNMVRPGEIVHGHDAYSTELGAILSRENIKVILMIRDPRDQAVSRMFHIRRDASLRAHSQFNDLSDEEALMNCIVGHPGFRSTLDLMALTHSWMQSNLQILCVKYEDLSLDPLNQLQRVGQYLGLPLNHSFLDEIIARNRFERLTIGKKIWKAGRKAGQEDPASHFRKGIVGDWKNYFKEEHKQRFKELAGDVLIEMGYEQSLSW